MDPFGVRLGRRLFYVLLHWVYKFFISFYCVIFDKEDKIVLTTPFYTLLFYLLPLTVSGFLSVRLSLFVLQCLFFLVFVSVL